MPDTAPQTLSFDADRAMRTLREHAPGRNLLAILTESTADEWHRRWERSGGTAVQTALVECFDFSRGATTAEPNVVSDELVVTEIERPVTGEGLESVTDRFFEGWAPSPRGTVLYIDSVAALRADTDRATVASLLATFGRRTREPESGFVASLSGCSAREAATFTGIVERTVGEPSFDSDAPTAVRRLRGADPTTFGYFRRYWRDAMAVLDRTERAYAQAGQLDSELSSRTLGATLSAFTRLDALAVRADTNGPNRYDCRSYDPERAAELGLAVESLPE